MYISFVIHFRVLAKSTVLCFSLKKGRSAMASFLDMPLGMNMIRK